MATPTILCTACKEPVEFKTEKEYKEHLLKVHSSTTTQGAMDIERAKKMNTPVSLPPGISEKDLPNKEFLETLKRAEEEKIKEVAKQASQASVPQPTPPTTPTLTLKYKYEGRAECGHEVKTIMLEAEGKTFAIGYDLVCDKMVKRIEVSPIKEEKNGNDGNKAKTTK
jgi:hypothetical protein